MAKDNIKRKAKSKNKHKAQEAGEGILDDVAVGRERQQERRLPIISSNCVEIEQRRGAHEQSRNANSRIDNLALDTGKSPLDTTSVKRNVAIFSNIWIVLSCFFCFTSSYYMPEDDYILYTGSDDETDIPVISSRKKKQKIPEAVIADSMRVLDWNSDLPAPNLQAIGTLTFCKEGDYFNDKELLGSHLLEEGQRIIKIFAGIKRISGLTFNWTLRASKKGIDVHTCDVPNSPWLAVKSDSIIKRDKFEILKLFLDDSRSHEYDETMEGYQILGCLAGEVQVRRYYYKPIWPTCPRDFILCSSWRELEDGCILMSTISPPDNVYPDTAGFVRAQVIISGVLIRPISAKSGGGCAVTTIGHSDLKGSIPSAIVNMLSVGFPMTAMKKIKEILMANV